MGDASGAGAHVPADDRAARERGRLVRIAVVAAVALVAAVVVAATVARPGSSSDSSVVALPSTEVTGGVSPGDPAGDGGGSGNPSSCTPEQDAVVAEVLAALPWDYTVAGDSSDQGDGVCLGPVQQIAQPYDDVVAALPAALASAGIQVTADLGSEGTTTFTGTASGGQSLGILVADDQTVGTVVGISVPPAGALGSG